MEAPSQKKLKLDSLNLTQGSQGQKTAMQKALHNPLILQKIVHSMDFPQLKNCRRINRERKLISTEFIKKKNSCSIEFNHDYFAKKNLETLNNILSKSENFPCSSFSFRISSRHLISREVEEFCQHNGSQIKTLRLFFSYLTDPSKTEIICQMIFKVAPTLENLHLLIDILLKFPANLEFPRLKSIYYLNSSDLLYFLRVAPNLKRINCKGMDHEILNVVKKWGKLHLIEDSSALELRKNVPNFEGLKLKKLEIEDHWDPVKKVRIQKLLELSKDSLRYLTLRDGFSPEFSIPKLANLKTLEILPSGRNLFFDPENPPIVLRKINLVETFPHLQVLALKNDPQCQNRYWTLVLSPYFYEGRFSMVKKMTMSSIQHQSWVTHLRLLCPNFTHLEITSRISPADLARVFELWPHLKELEMHDFTTDSYNPRFFMDSCMTGMSEETCARLRSLNSFEEQENWQNLVTDPSLRNLKRLKRFTIKLNNDWLLPLSRVSGIYSFKMMPLLKISLIVKLESIEMKYWMEELGSFVNITF